ncbi:unnamed protein product [Periconia digitata]|uniref:YEATS domain-containing protein n=1 Tax=Periconia digitata TaxID=1303443 RepID=A0A9W4UP40_9PLEO|nr:unnamed protein product [Periconia digitata]
MNAIANLFSYQCIRNRHVTWDLERPLKCYILAIDLCCLILPTAAKKQHRASSEISMDPLSIAASCLTLIAAVGNSTRYITNFVVSCRDARQDLAAISRELSDLDMTLHILKDDTQANGPNQLPEDLRQRICDIMGNCKSVLVELETLLGKYDGAGLERAARWALSGRKDAEKIRSSLGAHKGALGLVVEATTLHMTTATAAETKKVSKDTSLIKEYTMKIVEQLAKQDQILEDIAWIRAVVSQRATSDQERTLVMDKYLDSVTDYAGSMCGDSVSDDVAEEMRCLSLEAPTSSRDSSNMLSNRVEPSPFPSYETPDSMTIVLGNTHRLVEPQPDYGLGNKHIWSFYLRASGEEIIQEVKVHLHPTFVPSELRLTSSPYRVTRIGWGIFMIRVTIVLKPGYLWQNGNGRSLKIGWKLDFNGFGSSASHEYAVTIEKDMGLS